MIKNIKSILKNKIIISFVLVIVITAYVINTRQENYNDTLFTAHITNILIGKDGHLGLTGDECIDITKNFHKTAAASMYMDKDDIRNIMQTFKDEGGMADISSSLEYKMILKKFT